MRTLTPEGNRLAKDYALNVGDRVCFTGRMGWPAKELRHALQRTGLQQIDWLKDKDVVLVVGRTVGGRYTPRLTAGTRAGNRLLTVDQFNDAIAQFDAQAALAAQETTIDALVAAWKPTPWIHTCSL